MSNVNGWLMALAFLLGLVLTLFLLVRRVKREVPEYAALGRGPGVGAAGAGAAGAAGAAKLAGGGAKLKGWVEDEPYGSGSVRVKGTATAPDASYTVKGNEDSMLYHTTESPSWKQTIAEIWFRNVKDAERAGFARWDSGGAAKIAGAAAAGAAGGAAAAKLTGGASADADDAATLRAPKIDADADDAVTSKFSAVGTSGDVAGDADIDGDDAKTGVIATGAAAAAAGAGAATAKFAASGDVEEPYGAGSARVAAGAAAPSGYDIKGNEDSMLYHTLDSPSYKQTIAEVWFRDEPSAEAAGFTRWDKGRAKGTAIAAIADVPAGKHGPGSATPGEGGSGPAGWTIKGNEDSMLYHTLESPSYKRTIAEVWFFDEPTAEAAGFTHWKKGRAKPGGAAKIAELPPGPHGPGSATPGPGGSGPEGWTVKGNEDSMLYHSPESSAYDVTVAEVWFRDVATAEAAGFNRWDSGKSQRGKR